MSMLMKKVTNVVGFSSLPGVLLARLLSWFYLILLLNQTWVHLVVCWHQMVVKESASFIAGAKQGGSPGHLVVKRPELPEGFQGNVL